MDYYRAGSWEISTSQGQMMGSEAMDELGSGLGFKIPALVYNNTFARLKHDSGFTYEFLPHKALESIGTEYRKTVLYNGGEIRPESITVIPGEVKVSSASHWEGRTVPKSSTFSEDSKEQVAAKVFDSGNDWTFTSLYKGTVNSTRNYRIEQTNEDIPVHRLGMDNPILWASEIVLFEDELDDNGHCKFTFRIRSMQDCVFALTRLYLRVDHVLIRICDTRIFIDLSHNSILREFQYKESTYEELRKSGFDLSPQLTIHPRQSDLVYPSLQPLHIFKDKISFE